MPRTTKRIIRATLLSLAAVLIVGCGHSPDESPPEADFPNKLSSRLQLQTEGHDEVSREVLYWPGGLMLRSIFIEFASGASLHATFRVDGTAETLMEYYPPADGQRQPHLKRDIHYGSDGLRIESARFFREDGSLESTGEGLGEGEHQQLVYAEDGKQLVLHQVYDSDAELIYHKSLSGEENRSVTGKLASGKRVVWEFREDGTRLKRTVNDGGTRNELTTFYAEDGTTEQFLVYRYTQIAVVYLDQFGQPVEAREFTSAGGMTVFVYRPGVTSEAVDEVKEAQPTHVAYRQHWRRNYQHDMREVEFILDRVEELTPEGLVSKTYNFSNRRTLYEVKYHDEQGRVAKSHHLRDDGTVERIYYNEWGDKDYPDSTRSEGVEEEMVEVVDETLFAPLDFVDPRPLVGEPFPDYYCDEYGYDDHGYPCWE